MSDNEDDFFGLADGQILSSDGESDDEDAGGSGRRGGSESPGLSPQKDSPRPTKKVAGPKKAKKKGRDDGSDDEGEASETPGSPDSLQSAPMDESESDTEVPTKATARPTIEDNDDENKYPVEGIFASLAEKEDIMAMDELRRETILADRKLEIDRERQNRLLRQLVSNQESEEKKQKKRKASSADLDDEDTRKTPRARTSGKNDDASSKYDTLRRKRAELSDRVRAREERRRRGRSTTPNRRPSTRDSDRDPDDDRRKPRRSESPPRKSLEPASLRDIEHVRVGRSRFAHVCFYPGFEETITGCFARVNVGPDPDTGSQVYRMAIIKGFNTGKPYALPGRSSQIVTDQYVTLGVGKATRDWPFIMCSDGKFTEAEFNRYKKTCEVEGTPFPKSQALINKVEDIDALLNRAWTAEEMQQKVDRQNALLKKFMPKNKDQLRSELDRARAVGDDDRVADLEEKLASADAPRLAFRTSLQQPSVSAKNQQDTLAEINRRNRRLNAEEVRKAQIREKNHQRKLEEDPVRRLMSQKKMNQARKELNGGGSSRGSTPAVGTPKLEAKDAGNGGEKKAAVNLGASQNGVPSFHRPVMDDDVIESLDLGIDEDIEI